MMDLIAGYVAIISGLLSEFYTLLEYKIGLLNLVWNNLV